MDNITLDELVRKYLSHCKFEKNLDAKTIKAYRIDLTQFSEFTRGTGGAWNRETIQAYIAALHGQYKVKSVKRKVASLKAFFSFLEYEELIDDTPFSKLHINLHEPFLLPRTIPLSTIDVLLKCAYRHKAAADMNRYQYRAILRDIAVLELLFATGMRVSELCFLRPETVDLEERTIKIHGKGSKERIIQICNENVLSAVSAYATAFADKIQASGWFFVNRLGHRLSDQSVRFMIQKYSDLAGVHLHITPHMFRHSFATLLLEEDVDIRYIQQLLGHSSIVTTQIYTHVTSKKQRDILTTKHPRNKITTL